LGVISNGAIKMSNAQSVITFITVNGVSGVQGANFGASDWAHNLLITTPRLCSLQLDYIITSQP